MATLSVRFYGDPVLRRPTEPVPEMTRELRQLISNMVETMYDSVGIGLAAPQVGMSLKLCVLDEGHGNPRPYLNPRIVDRGGRVTGEEGCLSIPGIFADVARAEWVIVEARDGNGAPVREHADGLLARIFQHELDHLDGVLIIDHLDRVTRDRIKRRIKREGFPAHVGPDGSVL